MMLDVFDSVLKSGINISNFLILGVDRLTKKPHAMRARIEIASCVVK